MKITESEVLHVARLARLNLEHEELVRFQRELSSILDYMDLLNGIETRGVEPTFHTQSITNALREDTVKPSQSRHDALNNAPCSRGHVFTVPKVIE